MADQPNGNGNGRTLLAQIGISAAIALGIALITAFWSLADPRAEIKSIQDDIRNNYLSIREHNEYRDSVKADLRRIESDNVARITRAEVNATWDQRARELQSIHDDIRLLQSQLHKHEAIDRELMMKPAGQKP